MRSCDVPDQEVGTGFEMTLNGSDVLVTATACGDVDVGSVEVCVRFTDGTARSYDIGVGEYCRGEGHRLTRGMLNDGDTSALNALALEVGMSPDDVLTRLAAVSEDVSDRCISESAVG